MIISDYIYGEFEIEDVALHSQ